MSTKIFFFIPLPLPFFSKKKKRKLIKFFRYAYAALTELAWGKAVGKIINILINVSVFSSNIPALLIGRCTPY